MIRVYMAIQENLRDYAEGIQVRAKVDRIESMMAVVSMMWMMTMIMMVTGELLNYMVEAGKTWVKTVVRQAVADDTVAEIVMHLDCLVRKGLRLVLVHMTHVDGDEYENAAVYTGEMGTLGIEKSSE